MEKPLLQQDHSSAWIFHSWLSFLVSLSATFVGIFFLPVDAWTKGYLGMGMAYTVGSTINLTKTQRDLHESKKLASKLEEAKVERILAEHNSLKPL